ncbi:MAG: outer membrane protein transport protein [Verrucomicrobiia bacterium]
MGLGFRNPDQDARATGQGEAFVAQADDPSAVYYNPAGLVQLPGTQVSGGGYALFSHVKLDGVTNNRGMDRFSVLPHFYVVTDLCRTNSPWRFGFGVNVPFGSSVNWGKGSTAPFRYLVTESSLSVVNFAPTVAYRVNEHFSLGASLNIYYGTTKMAQDVPGSYFSQIPDANFRFEGSGMGIGATVGALWKINERHSFGAVYRSPFSINFKDNASLRNPSVGPSAAEARIPFPQSVAFGYAYRPMPKLKLEVDADWTNWDTLNSVRLNWGKGPLNGYTIPFNWMDSWFYEFGAQYELNERWTVRAGYIFSENSVPQKTFSPSFVDSDRHVLSAGLGYNTGRFGVDIVYQYSLLADRSVHQSPSPFGNVNGEWSGDGHAVMVTTTYKF